MGSPGTDGAIACVRLPELPLVAHHGLARPPEKAFVVHRGRGTDARVVFADATARAHGIRPGTALAGARARFAELRTAELDETRIARAQREVIALLLARSPRIAIGGWRRFWVEPASLGKSLPEWCDDVVSTLLPHQPVGLGVGPTATVAYAAARSVAHGHRIVAPPHARAFLDEASIEVLDVAGEALDVLASLGIRTVRQLRALDPVSLGMRFGPEVAEARRRADGVDPRLPLTPRLESAKEVSVTLDFPSPTIEPVVFLLRSAVERLLATLRAEGRGPLSLALRLALDRMPEIEEREAVVEVRSASPLVDERTVIEMLRTKLESLELHAPVVGLALVATTTSELRDRTGMLLPEGPGRDPAAREVALERLRSRLGPEAVRRAERIEVGALLDRARFRTTGAPTPGEALPFRRLEPPVPVERGFVRIAGRLRRIVRFGRVDRVVTPWWHEGTGRAELTAFVEVEGPMLVLLHARVSTDCEDEWEAIGWVD